MFISTLICFLFVQLTVQFEPIHNALEFKDPVQVVFNDNDATVMYVVEKDGIINNVSLDKDNENKAIILDIRDRVGVTHSEEGLLSMALHPSFTSTGEIFVWYTAQKPKRGILSKFTQEEGGKNINPASEKILLEVPQPWGNHNGGTILFGKDGFLYLGIGDGGSANDPHKNGQNNKTLLGTIIRIDVNQQTETQPYSIPQDNPFMSCQDVRQEIWAYGLRNPWRMSFDKKTGKLWVADVGQNQWEEIDIVQKGKNYGWNYREGSHEFFPSDTDAVFEEPVFEYGRKEGGSITGGYVYRGKKIPHLEGKYIFSDYLSRRIWALSQSGQEPKKAQRIAKKTPLAISSFGETPGGEIVCCGFETPYSPLGKIYRLELSTDSDLAD
jgi:glucose/arabinose dehydrogenase